LGGRWYGGLIAGAFYWTLTASSAYRYRIIGSRAVNALKQKPCEQSTYPATWQNIKNKTKPVLVGS